MDLKVLDDVPNFSGKETDSEKIEALTSYVYRLAEQLRYALNLLESKINDREA